MPTYDQANHRHRYVGETDAQREVRLRLQREYEERRKLIDKASADINRGVPTCDQR